MRHQAVNVDIALKHLALCKRNAMIFFICMVLLVIVIDPIYMTRSFYNSNINNYYLIIQRTYSLYAFNMFTGNLFLSLSVTCYLTVMMLFTSLSLKQIKHLLMYVIKMIDTNTLVTDHYMDAKDKIISLKNGSYLSVQLLTITAAINVIAFMFIIWYSSYRYFQSLNTYWQMIFFDFTVLPLLLKGYTYYYYYYYYYYFYCCCCCCCCYYYYYYYYYHYRDSVFLLYLIPSSINQYPS